MQAGNSLRLPKYFSIIFFSCASHGDGASLPEQCVRIMHRTAAVPGEDERIDQKLRGSGSQERVGPRRSYLGVGRGNSRSRENRACPGYHCLNFAFATVATPGPPISMNKTLTAISSCIVSTAKAKTIKR
jgi:hypothetical protein